MMLLTKWFSALTENLRTDDIICWADIKYFDSIIAFLRFLLEDVAQSTIQMLFLFHQERDGISNSSGVLVLCSVCFAFILSFIRAMALVVDPFAREALLGMFRELCDCCREVLCKKVISRKTKGFSFC